MTTSKSYNQALFNFANGLVLSNDATTPNTLLDVAAGLILDSTQTYQLALTAPAVINSAINGLNGLDTGAIAASTVYYVYLVGDPVDLSPTGAMISASTTPLLPVGYGAYALIGFVTTDSSKHFLKGIWNNGNGTARTFMYDSPQATAVTAGNATVATAVDLSAFVPKFDGKLVWMSTSYVPASAGNQFKMQPANGTGFPVVITGQVSAVAVTGQSYLASSLVAGVQKINYLVGNAGDAVAINVLGYMFYI